MLLAVCSVVAVEALPTRFPINVTAEREYALCKVSVPAPAVIETVWLFAASHHLITPFVVVPAWIAPVVVTDVGVMLPRPKVMVPAVVIGEPDTIVMPLFPAIATLVTVPAVFHVPSPNHAVLADAPVPLLRFVTGRLPTTPVVRGKPVALVRTPAVTVPMSVFCRVSVGVFDEVSVANVR